MGCTLSTRSFEAVNATLSGYASRGVFRGFSYSHESRHKSVFRISWHYECVYTVIFDRKKNIVGFNKFLDNVPGTSPMARKLRKFVKEFSGKGRIPVHRQVDAHKAEVILRIRNNAVSLSIASMDGDMVYATRKLINIANEILVVFLAEGAYYSYRVRELGVNPDRIAK